MTRSAALEGTDGSSKDSFIGKKGKDFEFAHVEPVKVEFVECNCKGDTDGKDPEIDAVYEWINTMAWKCDGVDIEGGRKEGRKDDQLTNPTDQLTERANR